MLRIILIALITLSVVALAIATCDDYSKNEAKCMATTEDSVKCRYHRHHHNHHNHNHHQHYLIIFILSSS